MSSEVNESGKDLPLVATFSGEPCASFNLSVFSRITEKNTGNGYKEVCDLDTGDCYTVRMRDGLIERVDNSMKLNKTLRVETPHGVNVIDKLNEEYSELQSKYNTIKSMTDRYIAPIQISKTLDEYKKYEK